MTIDDDGNGGGRVAGVVGNGGGVAVPRCTAAAGFLGPPRSVQPDLRPETWIVRIVHPAPHRRPVSTDIPLCSLRFFHEISRSLST